MTEVLVPTGPFVQVLALIEFLSEAALVPTFFNVPEQLDAKLIGIQPTRVGGHRPRVVIGIVHHFCVSEASLGHDLGVPVGGPPLVHDF